MNVKHPSSQGASCLLGHTTGNSAGNVMVRQVKGEDGRTELEYSLQPGMELGSHGSVSEKGVFKLVP